MEHLSNLAHRDNGYHWNINQLHISTFLGVKINQFMPLNLILNIGQYLTFWVRPQHFSMFLIMALIIAVIS